MRFTILLTAAGLTMLAFVPSGEAGTGGACFTVGAIGTMTCAHTCVFGACNFICGPSTDVWGATLWLVVRGLPGESGSATCGGVTASCTIPAGALECSDVQGIAAACSGVECYGTCLASPGAVSECQTYWN